MKRILHLLIILGLSVLIGCSRPSISLLYEKSMGDRVAIDVTYNNKSYICFYVHSVDQLNELLRQEEITKVYVRLSDGSKLKGQKVLVEDDLVFISDFADSVHVVELASVKSFVPHIKVPAAHRRRDLLIGVSMGAIAGSQVNTNSKLINPTGLAVGAAVGALIGAPLWLPDSKAQTKILNMYNEDVRNRTKVGL